MSVDNTKPTEKSSGKMLIKAWSVTVLGHSDVVQCFTVSRGKALASGFRAYRQAYQDTTFKHWLTIARVGRSSMTPKGFGQPIKVNGEDAFFIQHRVNTVTYCRPGGVVTGNAHELECSGFDGFLTQ